jgi:hypothetical protein
MRSPVDFHEIQHAIDFDDKIFKFHGFNRFKIADV